MSSQKQSSRKSARKAPPSQTQQPQPVEPLATPAIQPEPRAGRSPLPGVVPGRTAERLQKGPQVLVVDDEVVVRRVVTDYLEGKGYTVASVDSGESALEWLRENTPGIILLDIFMPGVNGLEVLRALKTTQPGAQVLVISGFADEELERKVKALGAVDCLRKPFDFATLHSIVASRLGQRAR